jgi:hypothetical protein
MKFWPRFTLNHLSAQPNADFVDGESQNAGLIGGRSRFHGDRMSRNTAESNMAGYQYALHLLRRGPGARCIWQFW